MRFTVSTEASRTELGAAPRSVLHSPSLVFARQQITPAAEAPERSDGGAPSRSASSGVRSGGRSSSAVVASSGGGSSGRGGTGGLPPTHPAGQWVRCAASPQARRIGPLLLRFSASPKCSTPCQPRAAEILLRTSLHTRFWRFDHCVPHTCASHVCLTRVPHTPRLVFGSRWIAHCSRLRWGALTARAGQQRRLTRKGRGAAAVRRWARACGALGVSRAAQGDLCAPHIAPHPRRQRAGGLRMRGELPLALACNVARCTTKSLCVFILSDIRPAWLHDVRHSVTSLRSDA